MNLNIADKLWPNSIIIMYDLYNSTVVTVIQMTNECTTIHNVCCELVVLVSTLYSQSCLSSRRPNFQSIFDVCILYNTQGDQSVMWQRWRYTIHHPCDIQVDWLSPCHMAAKKADWKFIQSLSPATNPHVCNSMVTWLFATIQTIYQHNEGSSLPGPEVAWQRTQETYAPQ